MKVDERVNNCECYKTACWYIETSKTNSLDELKGILTFDALLN